MDLKAAQVFFGGMLRPLYELCLAPTFLEILSQCELKYILLINTYLNAENGTNRIVILKVMPN